MTQMKTGTFRQAGYAAFREPGGSFGPSCPIWVEDGAITGSQLDRLTRALAEIMIRRTDEKVVSA